MQMEIRRSLVQQVKIRQKLMRCKIIAFRDYFLHFLVTFTAVITCRNPAASSVGRAADLTRKEKNFIDAAVGME